MNTVDIEQLELDFACRRARDKALRCLVRICIYAGLVELLRSGIITVSYPSVEPRMAAGLRYLLLAFTIIDLAAMRLMGKKLVANLIATKSPGGEWPDRNNAVQKIYLTEVIVLLIAELAAIYGLIVFYVSGGKTSYFYTFWLVSAVLIGIHFPRLEQWQDTLQEEQAHEL